MQYTHSTSKEMGKSEEEIQKLLKKRHSIYDGVKGIESTIAREDGIYHTLKIDYNNIDWKELHKRAPKTLPMRINCFKTLLRLFRIAKTFGLNNKAFIKV